MTYAWEAGKEKLTSDVSIFTEDWCNRNFSGNQGSKVADLYNTYAQITNVCKVEHMTADKFSQTAYGDEGVRRLERLEDIYNKGNGDMELYTERTISLLPDGSDEDSCSLLH